jgi:hypothetical protein
MDNLVVTFLWLFTFWLKNKLNKISTTLFSLIRLRWIDQCKEKRQILA